MLDIYNDSYNMKLESNKSILNTDEVNMPLVAANVYFPATNVLMNVNFSGPKKNSKFTHALCFKVLSRCCHQQMAMLIVLC